MILVATIVHSGTHSLLHSFDNYKEREKTKEIVHRHFAMEMDLPHALLVADSAYTTYRDPYYVAASWANTLFMDMLFKAGLRYGWYEQWEH